MSKTDCRKFTKSARLAAHDKAPKLRATMSSLSKVILESCDIIDSLINSHQGELGAMSIVLASYKSDIDTQAAQLDYQAKVGSQQFEAQRVEIEELKAEIKKLRDELIELSEQMMEKYDSCDMPELLGWHERIDKVLK